MELSPTLRAQLDVLQPYLDDEGVSEILVAGPDRVFVTRSGRSQRVELALPDRQIRALADRLLRALGSRADRVELRAGRLGDDLEVAVIGGPRADRCPVIRVQRAATPAGVLLELTAEGGLTAEGERRLADTVHARRAVVVVGPFGAPRARVVLALARSWHVVGRVIALEHEGGSVAQADVADLVLPIDGPVEAALAAAPDVLVTLDPPARLWTGLLTAGRPFVATLEAPDGRTGLERMVALALAGDARLSRSAAEALVLSAAADVVELGPGRELWVRRIGQVDLQQGRLHFAPQVEGPPPARAASLTSAGLTEPEREAPPRVASEAVLGTGTDAVLPAELVEALSREIEVAEVAPEAEVTAAPEAPEPAGPEELTRWATAEHVSRRPTAERMATVTGPPRPGEVARQVAQVLDELVGRAPSQVAHDDTSEVSSILETQLDDAPADPADRRPGAEGLMSLSATEEELTSHAVPPPDLDPFETFEGSMEPGPMDSTQAAEVGEMLAGERLRPRIFDIGHLVTGAHQGLVPLDGATGEWDEEAPSEVMPTPGRGRAPEPEPEEDDGPFENEKTPVAPLFEGASARRGRPRPRSTPPVAGESAADELGDPTRRRREAPESPRGGRPRIRRDRG